MPIGLFAADQPAGVDPGLWVLWLIGGLTLSNVVIAVVW